MNEIKCVIFCARFFLTRYRPQFWLIVSLSFVAAISEGLSIISFFAMVIGALGQGELVWMVWIEEVFAIDIVGNPELLLNALIFFFIFLTLRIFFTTLVKVYSAAVKSRIEFDLRLKMVHVMAMQSLETDYGRVSSGEFASLSVSEVPVAAGTFPALTQTLIGVIQLCVYLTIACLSHIYVALIFLLCGPLIYFFSSWIVTRIRILGESRAIATEQLSNSSVTYADGLNHFIILGQKDFWISKIEKIFTVMRGIDFRSRMMGHALGGFQEWLTAASVIICFSVVLTYIDVDLATIVTILLVFNRAASQLASVQGSVSKVNSCHGALSRFDKRYIKATAREVDWLSLNRIVLRDFSPGDQYLELRVERPVAGLKVFRSGRVYWLSGPSGSGKTQFLSEFISALFTWQAKHSDDKNMIRIASFKTTDDLFDGTVLDNILLDRYELARTSKFADLTERLEIDHLLNLRVSKNTEVSSLGLSTGEKTRILMARIFLAEPTVILLDEPFANLDARRSMTLLKLLGSMSADKIILIASHGFPQTANEMSIEKIEFPLK